MTQGKGKFVKIVCLKGMFHQFVIDKSMVGAQLSASLNSGETIPLNRPAHI
jgi:hypothetical protein